MKIAVFMGGVSSEREISLRTGKAILESLIRQGYDAYGVDLKEDNLLTAFTENEYDLAYLALHGEFGEDGRIQAVLDIIKKPYTGSGVTPSAIAMDKNMTKIIAEKAGIRIPKSYRDKSEIISFPVVVKPTTEGSSVGLYICNSIEEVEKAEKNLMGKSLLIEEFVSGEELTVGVLNGEPLGVLKISPKSGLYDFQSKYTVGMTEYEYPAKVSPKVYEEAMIFSKKIHQELGLSGVSRSDFILKDDKIYFLEVNTCPGMTETSLVPKLATLKGYTFDDLVKKIIQ
ncbi:D-alanine--D-alanine ligase [Ilyobacter polytropus]|uniref:D-alanine--D-alanine ligase n=1 Tax=Ilyobacter polytropus (strain ATCC 51220 / DSM 2926 / LMG 16218 / CuHBu1) TaxID=572544 RepID=E3H9U4_ILYPC|nr:D-alanine--D-alanine ligase [Ilyobacter polytropus]ADO83623.1 D-alanine--D-alanine ligase [Ilyobacter polytropus DSM 2926]